MGGICQYSSITLLLTTTPPRDTPEATSGLNVSCHLTHTPPIQLSTHLSGSMHACLNVDEIVRLIARELVGSGGNGTAVALACCHQSFEDPVLDVLWETQDRLLPLLKSFPRDVWSEGGYAVSVPTTCPFSLS